MLDYMRQQSRSFIIYFFFTILILVFVFEFGPQASGWTPTTNVTAATVAGKPIDSTDLDMEYTRQYGWGYARNQELDKVVGEKRSLLEDIVHIQLLASDAASLGMEPGPEEIKAFILDGKRNVDKPYFETDGVFDADLYNRVVTSGYRTSLPRYERARARELMARRLLEFLQAQTPLAKADVEEEQRLQNERVSLQFVAFRMGSEEAPAIPSDDEISSWTKTNEEDIKKAYAQRKNDFNRPKEVHLRQIFVKAVADDAAARAAGKKKSEDLRQQILAGTDMAELARKHSDHFSYREKGGDMGWQTAGNNDPAFDKAGFALNKGGISEVVETDIGFFVLRAEDIREAVSKSLDDVRPTIARELLVQNRRKAAAKTRADGLITAIKGGATWDDAIASLSGPGTLGDPPPPSPWKAEETGPFGQAGGMGTPDPLNPFKFERPWDTIPKIGRSGAMSRLAFSLTEDAPLGPEPIAVGDVWYVVRLGAKTVVEGEGAQAPDKVSEELLLAEASLLLGPWERALFARAFQRRLFGSAANLGVWLQRNLDEMRKTNGVEIDANMFNVDAPASQPSPGGAG